MIIYEDGSTEEEKVEQRIGKPIYDIMKCHDGATRAVPLVNGVLIDPSLPKKGEVDEKQPKKKVVSIQDRLHGKVEDFVSVLEGQVDDFVSSDYKLRYDVYNDLINRGCKAVHARKMRPLYRDCYNDLVDVYNNCLLYTSPSPRDGLLSRMPSSA